MFDRVLACMGKTTEDHEIVELAKDLGRRPRGTSTPNRDVHVSARGLELGFTHEIVNARYPVTKDGRAYRTYLSHAWFREGLEGTLPAPFRKDMSFAEMKQAYGDDFSAFGFEWDEITELRWQVLVDRDRDVVQHLTYWLAKGVATLELGVREEANVLSYLDRSRGDHVAAGFFLAFCAGAGLLAPELAKRAAEDVAKLERREMTGSAFLAKHVDHRAWDGEYDHVWACDLHPAYADFFRAYVGGNHAKAIWGKDNVRYDHDCERLLGKKHKGLKDHPPSWSKVPETWDIYDAIAEVLEARLDAWKKKQLERQSIIEAAIAEGASKVGPKATTPAKKKAESAAKGDEVSAQLARLDKALARKRKTFYTMSLVDGAEPAAASKVAHVDLAKLWAWKDGQEDWAIDDFAFGSRLLSMKESKALAKRNAERQKSGKLKAGWWNDAWIPFLRDEDGCICVDTSGCFGGPAGQVIRYRDKAARRTILAPSFEAWVRLAADAAEAGKAAFDDDEQEAAFVAKRLDGYPVHAKSP